MKSLKALSVVTVLGLAAVGFSGCSSAQKGAAGGGLVGGVAGAIIGNNIPANAPAAGAAIGAGSGAAVGGIAGDAYDQITDADVERELENLRAELTQRETELAALRESGLDPDALAELDAARAEIDSLQAQLQATLNEKEQIALTRSAVEQERDQTAAEVREMNSRIAALMAEVTAKEAENELLAQTISQKEAAVSDLRAQIDDKSSRLQELTGEMDVLRTSLTGKEQQLGALSGELQELNVQLEETTRGLTLTIVDSLLYMPGEAELTKDGKVLVGDVARIIKENFPGRELMIEGHTDNVPIRHSGWRSNWELGAGRALTLLHELVSQHGVDPALVSATSYGEFRPSATNATPDGRTQNRRAVIVILPEKLPLQRENLAQAK